MKSLKKMFSKDKDYLPELKTEAKAQFGCIGITDACMLRCKMCYKWKPDIFIKNHDRIFVPTVKQYREFIKGLKEISQDGFVLNFGGGEALLCDDIYDVIAAASETGIRTNLASNGYLVDKNIAKLLAKSGLDDIKLSLDSLNKETHDYLRGVDGVYEQLMRAIDNLCTYAPKIHRSLISVIYEQNYRDFIPLIEWINKNENIEHVLIMVPMQPNNTVDEERWWEGKYGFLWPKDHKKVDDLMHELILMKASGYKINNDIAQLRAAKKYLAHPERFVKRTACNMDRAVHVSSLGQIYFCFQYGVVGDIKKGDDIRQIWKSDKAKQVRANIRQCQKNCHLLINCFFEEDTIDDGHE